MANVTENLLIPNKWVDLVRQMPDGSMASDDLAGKRLLYMFQSVIEGKQVLSNDPAVDYFIMKYINDIVDMKDKAIELQDAKSGVSGDENQQIYDLRFNQKKTSKEISQILFGVEDKDSRIRYSDGWKKAQEDLKKVKKS